MSDSLSICIPLLDHRIPLIDNTLVVLGPIRFAPLLDPRLFPPRLQTQIPQQQIIEQHSFKRVFTMLVTRTSWRAQSVESGLHFRLPLNVFDLKGRGRDVLRLQFAVQVRGDPEGLTLRGDCLASGEKCAGDTDGAAIPEGRGDSLTVEAVGNGFGASRFAGLDVLWLAFGGDVGLGTQDGEPGEDFGVCFCG